MKKLFELILDGCWHKWKIIERVPRESRNSDGIVCDSWTRYYLQCERCGGIKVKDAPK